MALTGWGELRRETGPVFNPDTGTTTPPTSVVVWVGPCLVGYDNDGRAIEGATAQNLPQLRVRLPHSAPPLEPGDTFIVTDPGTAGDPDLVGRPLTITGVARRTLAVFSKAAARDRDAGVR